MPAARTVLLRGGTTLNGGPLAASPLPAIAPTGKRENTAFGEASCVKLLLSPFGERRETCRWT